MIPEETFSTIHYMSVVKISTSRFLSSVSLLFALSFCVILSSAGTAIYVYFNVPHFYAAVPIQFYLDGSYAGQDTGYGGPSFQDSLGLQYNTLVYSASNLPNGTHSVIVINKDYRYSPPEDNLFYFDYAIYT